MREFQEKKYDFVLKALKAPLTLEEIVGLDKMKKEVLEDDCNWDDEI